MHVREFTKPSPVTVSGQRQAVVNGTVVYIPAVDTFTFEQYVGEYVWSHSKWNTEEGWDDAQIRIGDAIEATPEGGTVKLDSLDDWEKLREANKAADIKGPNAHRIRRHQKAIKNARPPAE